MTHTYNCCICFYTCKIIHDYVSNLLSDAGHGRPALDIEQASTTCCYVSVGKSGSRRCRSGSRRVPWLLGAFHKQGSPHGYPHRQVGTDALRLERSNYCGPSHCKKIDFLWQEIWRYAQKFTQKAPRTVRTCTHHPPRKNFHFRLKTTPGIIHYTVPFSNHPSQGAFGALGVCVWPP